MKFLRANILPLGLGVWLSVIAILFAPAGDKVLLSVVAFVAGVAVYVRIVRTTPTPRGITWEGE